MPILPVDQAVIRGAADRLRAGGLVVFPTETVYGVGADAGNDRAVAAVFDVKGRPSFNPLIVHVADLAAAERVAVFDVRARYLAKRLWPAPLTLVLPRRPDARISRLATAGLNSVAVRVPDHPVALQLLMAFDGPVVAPSANRSNELSPTAAEHAAASLEGRVDLILDGGPCRIGVESTVLDLTAEPPAILRPGGITPEVIEASIGTLGFVGDRRASPGQQPLHYAPKLPIRLDGDRPKPMEALLAFGPTAPKGFAKSLNLSPSGNLQEAAANLFAYLYELDDPQFSGINAMTVPDRGLGLAINDRLRRAAGQG